MEKPEARKREQHNSANIYIKGVDPRTYEKFSSCCAIMHVQYAELFNAIVEDYWRRKGRHLKAGQKTGHRWSWASIVRKFITKAARRDARRLPEITGKK